MPHWKELEVVSLQGAMATWEKCRITMENGAGATVLVANLPGEVRTHLAEVARLEGKLRQARAQVEAYEHRAKLADATAPRAAYGDWNYVDEAMAERQQANVMLVNAETARIQLEKAEAEVAKKTGVKMKVLAMKTGTYSGLDIWDCGKKR